MAIWNQPGQARDEGRSERPEHSDHPSSGMFGRTIGHAHSMQMATPMSSPKSSQISTQMSTPVAAPSKTTSDHDTIERWVEERGGWPARVRIPELANQKGSILRIDFPAASGPDDLEPIEWDDFFQQFEAEKLALNYQEDTEEGDLNRNHKLINRDATDSA